MDLPVSPDTMVEVAALAVAGLTWRYPRAAPAPRPDPPKEEEDDGLALVLGALALVALNRRKARAEKH